VTRIQFITSEAAGTQPPVVHIVQNVRVQTIFTFNISLHNAHPKHTRAAVQNVFVQISKIILHKQILHDSHSVWLLCDAKSSCVHNCTQKNFTHTECALHGTYRALCDAYCSNGAVAVVHEKHQEAKNCLSFCVEENLQPTE